MPRQGCPEYSVRPIGPRPSDVVVSGVGSRVRGCGTISKLLLKEFVHGLDVLSFSLERLLILISDPCSDYQKQRVNVQVVTHDKQGLFREIDVDKRGKISLQQWIDFLRQSMTPCVSPMTRTSGLYDPRGTHFEPNMEGEAAGRADLRARRGWGGPWGRCAS